MSQLFDKVKDGLQKENKRKIVFPEATDQRILTAASKLAAEGLLLPVLIGDEVEIKEKAQALGLKIASCQIINPHTYGKFEAMLELFLRIRAGRNTENEAREILVTPNYFGTMLVQMGEADGLVSGAVHSTSDTVRPALQIIKTKEGIKKTSGVFVMVREDERYIFGDCAINIAPTSEDLAEIALESKKTALVFDIDPKVAMLSFSTKGSAVSEETKRVEKAIELAKEKDAHLVIDGEFQFDAAFVPSVAKQKAPDSPLAGDATVFIFPSLEAGNIGYKIAERLGGFEAVGPILQGLNKPVNDLSRGCSAEDVYKLALITAAQA